MCTRWHSEEVSVTDSAWVLYVRLVLVCMYVHTNAHTVHAMQMYIDTYIQTHRIYS